MTSEKGEETAITAFTVRPSVTAHDAKKGFVVTVRSLWGLVRNYTASDIDRLKEAGIRQVEGKAAILGADAEEKLANAAKAYAEAEKLRAEADAIRAKTRSDEAQQIAVAVDRVKRAISRIKQNGGDVALDSDELQKLLLSFPEADTIEDSSGAS